MRHRKLLSPMWVYSWNFSSPFKYTFEIAFLTVLIWDLTEVCSPSISSYVGQWILTLGPVRRVQGLPWDLWLNFLLLRLYLQDQNSHQSCHLVFETVVWKLFQGAACLDNYIWNACPSKNMISLGYLAPLANNHLVINVKMLFIKMLFLEYKNKDLSKNSFV